MGLFDGFKALRKFIEPIVEGGSKVINFELDRRANEEAAETASRAAAAKAEAIRRGDAAAIARLDQIIAAATPGAEVLRAAATADPTEFTPGQARSLDQTRRDTDARLATTGVRGAGRAVTAAIRDVDEGAKAEFIQQNQARSDAAASQLFGPLAGAVTGQANIEAGTGRDVGRSVETAGVTKAAGDLATAGARGQALADITSIGLDAIERRGRRGRHEDRDTETV